AGVSAGLAANARQPDTLSPQLELLDPGGSERVSSSEEDPATFRPPVISELRDGRSLSDTVHPDNQDHGKSVVKECIERLRTIEDVDQLFLQPKAQVLAGAKLSVPVASAQAFQELVRGLHSDISCDEELLEVIPHLVGDLRLTQGLRHADKERA